MIDQLTIDRIMDAANIVDVVSQFVTLRKRGVNYIGLCPFHSERTPSFSVSPSKGICKCFSCGKGGNVVHFLMEHEQMSYYEALKWLANRYNIPIQEKELTEEQKQNLNLRESLFVVNQFANEYFQQMAKTDAVALAYFRSRGFRDDTIKKFQLGYCPSLPRTFADTAIRKGYKKEFLVQTGLCYQKEDKTLVDRFRGRVIFPVHTLSGKVVAFGGRVLNTATKGVQMKYVNSPESEIYHKSNELYGIFFAKHAIVSEDRCFLVEGYTDVISMHQCGVENVVASSGTALTAEQIRKIHRLTDNVTVLYDGDAAGIKASLRGIDMFLHEGMNIKVCLLPDGDDPDSFARKHNATDFQAYISQHSVDFLRFKADLLLEDAGNDPQKKTELIQSMVRSIAVIPDMLTRAVYTKECCAVIGLSEQVLWEAVGKENKRLSDEEKQRLSIEKRRNTNEKYKENNQSVGNSTQSIADFIPPFGNNSQSENKNESPQIPTLYGLHDPIDFKVWRPSDIPPLRDDVPTGSPTDYVVWVPDTSTEQRKKLPFETQERELVRMIIRYGERIVCEVEDDEGNTSPLSVIEWISRSLEEDEMCFQNPLYAMVMLEAKKMMKYTRYTDRENGAQFFFLNHSNSAIGQLALELVSDRYQLSRYHSKAQNIASEEDRLFEILPLLLTDYKLAVVEHSMNKILQQLSLPEVTNDPQKYSKLMHKYQELQQVKSVMAKADGDRIIIP